MRTAEAHEAEAAAAAAAAAGAAEQLAASEADLAAIRAEVRAALQHHTRL